MAKSLAQDVARRYPPAIANNPDQVVSQQRLSDILDEVFARVADFGRENKLGWFKRATLGRIFRWELNELGYEGVFVEKATERLVLYVRRNLSQES